MPSLAALIHPGSRTRNLVRLALALLCAGALGCMRVTVESGGQPLDPAGLEFHTLDTGGGLSRIQPGDPGVTFQADALMLGFDPSVVGVVVRHPTLGSGLFRDLSLSQHTAHGQSFTNASLAIELQGHQDLDGDGISDYDELVVLGTDPLSAAGGPDGGDGGPTPTPMAFPGAEGFGADTVGGRGGVVIPVTTLEDLVPGEFPGHLVPAPGSLRAAIEAEGPRIVVFHIAGTIELDARLNVYNPYITIAGQTAPGGGVAVRNRPDLGSETMRIATHDVVIRHLRFRPGPSQTPSCCVDAITIGMASSSRKTYNVVLDHISTSWSSDENINLWGDVRDMTIQWSLTSEGILYNHETTPSMSCGLLVSNGTRNVSIHHNLFAHNAARNPRIRSSDGMIDIVNNVVFDFDEGGAPIALHTEKLNSFGVDRLGTKTGRLRANVVGNYMVLPPTKAALRDPNKSEIHIAVDVPGHTASVHTSGNEASYQPELADDWRLAVGQAMWQYLRSSPHPTPPITTTSAQVAYQQVLADAGATRPLRDATDQRIVNDVQGLRHRRVRFHPNEVGGWPTLANDAPRPDRDGDGMPNAWERSRGLNPDDGSDGNGDADGDGYTNVEEYLNGTDVHGYDA